MRTLLVWHGRLPDAAGDGGELNHFRAPHVIAANEAVEDLLPLEIRIFP
jgi:hypothetical protein